MIVAEWARLKAAVARLETRLELATEWRNENIRLRKLVDELCVENLRLRGIQLTGDNHAGQNS